jgi:AcrR family transcriptional regulator
MPPSVRRIPKQQRAVDTRDALLRAASRVFARTPYAEARLKDIAQEADISEGALHFHFGNKRDVAAAVLDAQQEKMTALLARESKSDANGLARLLGLIDSLANLIASDVVVQAGIKLGGQPASDLNEIAHEPYFEWIQITRTLIHQGVEDGSIASSDSARTAELINAIFIGEQVLSELADKWQSLPSRLDVLRPEIVKILAPTSR